MRPRADSCTPPGNPTRPLAAAAFGYPFSIRGVVAIVGASLVIAFVCATYRALLPRTLTGLVRPRYSARGWLIAIGCAVGAYLLAYLASIVQSSGRNGDIHHFRRSGRTASAVHIGPRKFHRSPSTVHICPP